MNNTEFLQGLREQRPEAVKHLTECYLPTVWRFVCMKVSGDQHLAEDIVSESVLALIRAVDGETEIEHPGAWLRTVAGRRVQDHFRAAARVKHLMEQVKHVTPEADEDDALSHQLTQERRREVIEVMDELPDQQRTALEWKYIDKLSVREIASRFGVTDKTVEAMLFRARNKFKKILSATQAVTEPLPERNKKMMRGSDSAPRDDKGSDEIREQRLQTGFGGS